MDTSDVAILGAQWLWEQYGNALVKKGWMYFQKEWRKVGWTKAEKTYRQYLVDAYSTTRLLGYPQPVSVDGIYTTVYVLNNLSSLQHYTLRELQRKARVKEPNNYQKRQSVMNIINNEHRLFIVGKPGSGKTTILKHLTLQAAKNKIKETPILISLKDWADSSMSLLNFVVQQFGVCGFPDPKPFVVYLLKKGSTLVMFDGLDEVEKSKHREAISAIKKFSNQFRKSKIIVTCRIAAVDYMFEKFTYVEIADFSRKQVFSFISKWYENDKNKYKKFIAELQKPENKRLYELTKTPLLLALLCLVFDETMALPKRRVDLYKESLDALLRKWDASRGIVRDQVYHKLPPRRKEQLLSAIATENFVLDQYFIPKSVLCKQIEQYMRQLPPSDVDHDLLLDGETVLKSIEAQHGLLVERAYGIYAFSHLTFQEYLVARYIVENTSLGTLSDLYEYLDDPKWREVILMVSSLLDNADGLLQQFSAKQKEIVNASVSLQLLLGWINRKSEESKIKPRYMSRLILLFVALVVVRIWLLKNLGGGVRVLTLLIKQSYQLIETRSYLLEKKLLNNINNVFQNSMVTNASQALDLMPIYQLVRTMGVDLKDFPIAKVAKLKENGNIVSKYMQFASLFLECLDLSALDNRKLWQEKLFVDATG